MNSSNKGGQEHAGLHTSTCARTVADRPAAAALTPVPVSVPGGAALQPVRTARPTAAVQHAASSSTQEPPAVQGQATSSSTAAVTVHVHTAVPNSSRESSCSGKPSDPSSGSLSMGAWEPVAGAGASVVAAPGTSSDPASTAPCTPNPDANVAAPTSDPDADQQAEAETAFMRSLGWTSDDDREGDEDDPAKGCHLTQEEIEAFKAAEAAAGHTSPHRTCSLSSGGSPGAHMTGGVVHSLRALTASPPCRTRPSARGACVAVAATPGSAVCVVLPVMSPAASKQPRVLAPPDPHILFSTSYGAATAIDSDDD